MSNVSIRFVVAIILGVFVGTSALAGKGGGAPAPGSLDTTFDGDGKAVTNVSGITDYGRAVLVQGNGKIVVGGQGGQPGADDFELVRYLPGGGLDPGFGNMGKVITDFPSTSAQINVIRSYGTDQIIAAGAAGDDFALVRYNANGTLDPQFGTGGKVITSVSADNGTGLAGKDVIYDVAVMSDGSGRIVVVGTALNGVHGCGRCGNFFFDYSIAMARYESDGTLDRSFGSQGILVLPDIDPGTVSEIARSVKLIQPADPGGKILIGGTINYNDQNASSFLAARLYSGGTPDTTFGANGDGKVRTSIGIWAEAYDMALYSNDRFVLAGSSSYNFAVARYFLDGSLDASFDTDGILVTDMGGGDYAQSVVVQSDGKTVVGGRTDITTCDRKGVCTGKDFALARYNTGGILDPGFGSGGKVTVGITSLPNATTGAYDVVLQTDGKIVAAGTVYSNTQQTGNYTDYYDFGVARFIP